MRKRYESRSKTTGGRGAVFCGTTVPFSKTRTATLVDGVTYSHCSQLLPIPQSRTAIPTPWPSSLPPRNASRSPPEQSVSLARSSPSRPLPHPVTTTIPEPLKPNRHRSLFLLRHLPNPHYGTDSATSTPWHHFSRPLRPTPSPLEPTTLILSHRRSENSPSFTAKPLTFSFKHPAS